MRGWGFGRVFVCVFVFRVEGKRLGWVSAE